MLLGSALRHESEDYMKRVLRGGNLDAIYPFTKRVHIDNVTRFLR